LLNFFFVINRFVCFLAKTDGPIQARPPDVAPHAIGFSVFNPREIIVRAGEDLKISVPFVGSPAPQITFAKGGDDIKPDGNTQITVKDGIAELIVPKVKSGDTGIYSCTLKNNLGQETVQMKVIVVDKPGLIEFFLSNKKCNLYVFFFSDLRCT